MKSTADWQHSAWCIFVNWQVVVTESVRFSLGQR